MVNVGIIYNYQSHGCGMGWVGLVGGCAWLVGFFGGCSFFCGQQKKHFWSLSNFRGAVGDLPKMTQKMFKTKLTRRIELRMNKYGCFRK